MLNLFKLHYYKNFRKNVFAFKNGFNVVSGGPSTGKTNLGNAIMCIRDLMVGYELDLYGILHGGADSPVAEFLYEFYFDGITVVYNFSLADSKELVKEELSMNNELLFSIGDSQDQVYCNTSLINLYTSISDVFLENYIQTVTSEGRIPLLRWLLTNTAYDGDSVLNKLRYYIGGMRHYKGYESIARMVISEQWVNSLEVDLARAKLPNNVYLVNGELALAYKNCSKYFDEAASSKLKDCVAIHNMLYNDNNISFLYADTYVRELYDLIKQSGYRGQYCLTSCELSGNISLG